MVKNLQCRKCGFDPWVGKIPWRRERLPTPVFLPGDSHGQRGLAGCSPRGRKESDTPERLKNHRATAQAIKFKTERNEGGACDFSGKEGEGSREGEARSLGDGASPALTSCLRQRPLPKCCPLPGEAWCLLRVSVRCHPTRPVQSLAVSVGLHCSARLLSGLLVFSLPACLPRVVLRQCLTACVSACFKALMGCLGSRVKVRGHAPACLALACPLISSWGCSLPLTPSSPTGSSLSLNVPLTDTHAHTHVCTHTGPDIWTHNLHARPWMPHESHFMLETARMVGPAVISISAKVLEALEWPAESLRSRSRQVP